MLMKDYAREVMKEIPCPADQVEFVRSFLKAMDSEDAEEVFVKTRMEVA